MCFTDNLLRVLGLVSERPECITIYGCLRFLVGGYVGQQSPFFQEEFPQLAPGGEEKSPQQKKEEEGKESQYGPGPSLRPQSKSIHSSNPWLRNRTEVVG